MNSLKIRTILQGSVKYRDGKKWKKRYCLLALSPGTSDAMHLYIAKSYDEFSPYRNSRCIVDMASPAIWGPTHPYSSVASNKSYTKEHEVNSGSQSGLPHAPKPLINSSAQSCLSAVEATAKGLSAANNLATRLNAPVAIDEITGFESGCHLDKESNVIVLIGITSVHIIALETFDEMFRWAGAMTQIVTDCQFRVTLRKSSEGSKLPQGIQGSLHFQHWRLCLIGEPLAGCKFICSWKLDSIDKAYTITLPANDQSHGKSTALEMQSNHGSRWSFTGEVSHRISLGSLAGYATPGGGNAQVSKPKHSFILEASNSAGKGRGTHTFELEGGSLTELTTVLERFMSRRYYPDQSVEAHSTNDIPEDSQLDFSPGTPSSLAASVRALQQQQLSSSPDGCGSRHSVSPAQNFSSGKHLRNALHPSPVSMPTAFPTSVASACTGADVTLCGRSTQTLPSNRSNNPPRLYSNLIPCTSSLSPPELLSGGNKLSEHVAVRLTDKKTSETDVFNCTPQHSSCNSPKSTGLSVDCLSFEETGRGSDPSQFQTCASSEAVSNHAHLVSTLPSSWNKAHSKKSLDTRSLVPFGPSVRPSVTGFNDLDDDVQVARVAAGLVIPKILASPWTPNAIRTKHPLSWTQPPVLSSRNLLRHGECDVVDASVTLPDPAPTCISEPIPQKAISQFSDSRSAPTHQLIGCKPPTGPSEHRLDVSTKVRSMGLGSNRSQRDLHNHELSPTSCLAQHGVFTADEDLWDVDQTDLSRVDVTAIQRAPAHSQFSADQQSSQARDTKPIPLKDTTVSCPWCRRKKELSDIVSYQMFRQRCQQYRICWCHAYAGRSLSAATLLLLDFAFSEQGENFPPMPQFSLLNEQSVPTQLEPRLSLDQLSTRPAVFSHKYAFNSTTRQNNGRTCGSVRWKPIHRLFQRKQSKSHDNIDQDLRGLDSKEVDKKIVLSSSMTEAEIDLGAYPHDMEFKPQSADAHQQLDRDKQTDAATKRPVRLFIRCPRHGVFSPSLMQSMLNSPLHHPLCSRCRKRKRHHRVSHPTDRVTNHRTEQPNSITGDRLSSTTIPSLPSTFRPFVWLRPKSRGGKSALGKFAATRKLAVAAKDQHTRTSITQPVPEGAEFEFNRPSVHASQSMVDTHPSRHVTRPQPKESICDNLQYERIARSALSLTSLPCSEPAISRLRIPFERIWEFDTRSSSSLSSLLTFRSRSGSSSLASACYGKKQTSDSLSQQNLMSAGRGSQRDPRDLLEEIGNGSLCDTDELSSGSLSSSNDRHASQLIRQTVMAKHLDIPHSPSNSRPRRSDMRNPSGLPEVNGREFNSLWGSSAHSWSQTKSGFDACISDQNRKACASSTPCSNHDVINSSCSVCVPSTDPPVLHAQRANTLPTAKMFRSNSERKSSDSKASQPSGDSSIVKLRFSTDSKPHGRTMPTIAGLDRFFPRFTRKSRCNSRYNTATVISNPPGSMRLARKLSSQSDVGVVAHSYDDLDGFQRTLPHRLTEPVGYCNVVPVQHSSTSFRLEVSNHDLETSTKSKKLELRQSDSGELNLNPYVNLSVAAPCSGRQNKSRSGRRLQQPIQSADASVKEATSVFNQESSTQAHLQCKIGSENSRYVRSGCMHKPRLPGLDCGPNLLPVGAGDQPYPLHLPGGMGPSDLPAEVRDPSRNYAMVDLRPSPASSTHVHTELTVSSMHQPNTSGLSELTYTTSSTSSTLGFSNSTSTGSDCTSDAATLTSDTMGSYAVVCPVETNGANATGNSTMLSSDSMMPPKEPSRRRHSHSLSSAPTEAPVLNYVDVIASAAPFSTPDSTRRVDPSTLSDPSGSSIPEHTDSLSSSSGLGGIASQSITPPLAPTGSASFGDIFISRSMTSSATSAEGATADHGFHSCSPPDSNCVAYTQIDITRTMALEQLSGDIDEENFLTTDTSTHSHPWSYAKPNRSTSVRKTLSKPIKSIRRGTHKKSGGFFS